MAGKAICGNHISCSRGGRCGLPVRASTRARATRNCGSCPGRKISRAHSWRTSSASRTPTTGRLFATADFLIVLQHDDRIGRDLRRTKTARDHAHRHCPGRVVPRQGHRHGFDGRNCSPRPKTVRAKCGLHVEPFNPALRLYQLLGFTLVENQGVYDLDASWVAPIVEDDLVAHAFAVRPDRYDEQFDGSRAADGGTRRCLAPPRVLRPGRGE